MSPTPGRGYKLVRHSLDLAFLKRRHGRKVAAVSVAGNLAWHCYHALGRNGRTAGHSTPED